MSFINVPLIIIDFKIVYRYILNKNNAKGWVHNFKSI